MTPLTFKKGNKSPSLRPPNTHCLLSLQDFRFLLLFLFSYFLVVSLPFSYISSFTFISSSPPFSTSLSLSTSFIHPPLLLLLSNILPTVSLQFSPFFSQDLHSSHTCFHVSTFPPHILHCFFFSCFQYHSPFISFLNLNLAILFHLLSSHFFFKYSGMPNPFTVLYYLLLLELVILSIFLFYFSLYLLFSTLPRSLPFPFFFLIPQFPVPHIIVFFSFFLLTRTCFSLPTSLLQFLLTPFCYLTYLFFHPISSQSSVLFSLLLSSFSFCVFLSFPSTLEFFPPPLISSLDTFYLFSLFSLFLHPHILDPYASTVYTSLSNNYILLPQSAPNLFFSIPQTCFIATIAFCAQSLTCAFCPLFVCIIQPQHLYFFTSTIFSFFHFQLLFSVLFAQSNRKGCEQRLTVQTTRSATKVAPAER